jgi:hypothetical protein
MAAELFQVGDRVTMSEYGMDIYGPTVSNPHFTEGEIIEKMSYSYRVAWENGYRNVYRDEHLQLTEEKDTFKSFMRKLDERDTLPKVQRVRARGKTSPKEPATSYPSAGLGNTMGLSPGTTLHFCNYNQ